MMKILKNKKALAMPMERVVWMIILLLLLVVIGMFLAWAFGYLGSVKIPGF